MNEPTEYKGCTIRLEYEDDPMDPREWDNLWTFANWSRHYCFGDADAASLEDFQQMLEDGEIRTWYKLYVYDHSAQRIFTSADGSHMLLQGWAAWDTSCVGVAYVTHKSMEAMGCDTDEQVASNLEGELEELNAYINGWVYVLTVEDENGDEIESCGGYYDGDYAESEGKSIIDRHLREKAAV